MKSCQLLKTCAIAACVTGGAFLATLAAPELLHTATVRASSTNGAHPTPRVNTRAISPLANLSAAFRAVHRSIENAVVNIHTVQTIKSPAMNKMMIPPQLRGFFPPGQAMPNPMQQAPEKLEGTGSGVIINAQGYIVTNNHVVQGAQSIVVRLRDRRTYKATVVGTDPKTDLAVIKINAPHLTYAKFGNSHKIKVGDWVLAFGSPFGFSQTMTQGIISAKHRSKLNIIAEHNPKISALTYENYLQTDAAINPGNSGGPLVNLRGHVIGINSAIASSGGGFNGLGFAIPSNEVKTIMYDLIKHGKVVRGYLGVGIASVRSGTFHNIAKTFGYNHRHGVLISQVLPDSPAAKAGVKRGDIIRDLDGKKIRSLNAMRNEIAMMHPGTKVSLKVFRRGQTKDLTFPLGTQPQFNPEIASAFNGSNGQVQAQPVVNKLGMSLRDMTPALFKKFGMHNHRGVLVVTVNPNGPAAAAGLAPQEVILSIQGHTINSVQDFNALFQQNAAKGFRMSVRGPGGAENYVFIPPMKTK